MARHGENIRKRKDGRWLDAIRYLMKAGEGSFTVPCMEKLMKR